MLLTGAAFDPGFLLCCSVTIPTQPRGERAASRGMGKAGGAAITAPRGLGKSQVVAFPILATQEGGLWKSNEWNFFFSLFFFFLFFSFSKDTQYKALSCDTIHTTNYLFSSEGRKPQTVWLFLLSSERSKNTTKLKTPKNPPSTESSAHYATDLTVSKNPSP